MRDHGTVMHDEDPRGRQDMWIRQVNEAKTEGPPNIGFRWLGHPVVWARWRNDVRRQGPYAPDLDEWLRQRDLRRQEKRGKGSWPTA